MRTNAKKKWERKTEKTRKAVDVVDLHLLLRRRRRRRRRRHRLLLLVAESSTKTTSFSLPNPGVVVSSSPRAISGWALNANNECARSVYGLSPIRSLFSVSLCACRVCERCRCVRGTRTVTDFRTATTNKSQTNYTSNWKKTTHASEKRVPPRSRARAVFSIHKPRSVIYSNLLSTTLSLYLFE